MITQAPTEPTEKFSRTIRRLAEAELAVQQGHATAAIMLLRSALEAASIDAFGSRLNGHSFLTVAATQAGASRRLVNRLLRLRGETNAVVHAERDGRLADAREMLRLFRVVGCRWIERTAGTRFHHRTPKRATGALAAKV